MKRIITILLLVIYFNSSAQTEAWHMWDNFEHFSYSTSICRIDSNNNVYTKYSSAVTQYGNTMNYIEKYDSNGSRVTTFGTDGILDLNVFLPTTSYRNVEFFEITSDGKLLCLAILGSVGQMRFVKLNSDGTLDTSFGTSGIKDIYTDTVKYNERLSEQMIEANGNYYVMHNYENNANKRFTEVSCFDSSGNLVSTFANQGTLEVNYGATYTTSHISKIDYANNSLYVYGSGYISSTNTYDYYLSRLNAATGLPDPIFGTNGRLPFNGKSPSLIQADGKIIHMRTVDISPAQRNFQATRYLADGITIDSSFGTNGTMTLAAGWTSYGYYVPYNLPNGDFLLHLRLTLFASDQDGVMYVKNSGVKDLNFGGNITDNGNPVRGIYGLPTYKANPGTLSLGTNYFVTTSNRQALPQSVTTTKVNYTFPALTTNANSQHGFKILPNPSDSEINIESTDAFTTVRIYNIEGRLLNISVIDNPALTYSLDISNLSKGVYMVEVQSENHREIQKLVKN